MTLMPVFVSAVFCLLNKKTSFSKLKGYDIIVGVVFGIAAVMGTEFGVESGRAILNTRDASVICAGVLFGWRASVIAALIGGIERFFSPLWGGGEFTKVACSVATLFAGVFTSLLSEYVFRKKRPDYSKGLLIAMFIEVFHMLLVFVTHWSNVHNAFVVVQSAAMYLIGMNAVSVTLALIIADLIDLGKLRKAEKDSISTQIGTTIALAMFLAFGASVLFNAGIQNKIRDTDTTELLAANIVDVEKEIDNLEIDSVSKEEIIKGITTFRHIGSTGYIVISSSDGALISDIEDSGYKTLSDIGLCVDEESCFALNKGEIKGVKSYYMYDRFNQYLILTVLPESEADFTRSVSVYVMQFMELLIFAVLFVVLVLLIRKLVIENVERINRDLKVISQGNLDVSVQLTKTNEFSSIATEINGTVTILKNLMEESKKNMEKELHLARQIQHESVPHLFPPFPFRTDVDVFASMRTAKDVGGDFFDFFFVDSTRLFFLIADVSGKGIPAAMFMMKAKTTIRNLAKTENDVSEIFRKANNALCENNESGMFVTSWIGCLDTETGELNYCNAGHNPPVFLSDGKVEMLRNVSGLVLAGFSDMPYKSFSLTLKKGDRLFLYTDGVTEAIDCKNSMYSEDRLCKELENELKKSSSITEVCNNILASVDMFTNGKEQFDDITMLCLEYNGK